jgi:hypothetical protein
MEQAEMNGSIKQSLVIAAMASLIASGAAVADHKPGHTKGNGGSPKLSVDVENLCELLVPGVNDVTSPTLKVTTTVTDTSDDNNVDPAVVTQKHVDAVQFVQKAKPPKKKEWKPVGAPDNSLDSVVEINLCDGVPLSDDAKAVNASVQVSVGDRNFMSRCDDPFLDGDDLDGDGTDDVDQSRIDLDEYDPRPSCQ